MARPRALLARLEDGIGRVAQTAEGLEYLAPVPQRPALRILIAPPHAEFECAVDGLERQGRLLLLPPASKLPVQPGRRRREQLAEACRIAGHLDRIVVEVKRAVPALLVFADHGRAAIAVPQASGQLDPASALVARLVAIH